MAICAFFGHKDAPYNVKSILKQEVIKLIETESVNRFYVGKEGAFDSMVAEILKEVKNEYVDIEYYIVLAYLPTKRESDVEPCSTIYPEGLELTPKKLAISKRNAWMVEQSDFVVVYISRSFGGAVKFKTLAEKKNKNVINIFDMYK